MCCVPSVATVALALGAGSDIEEGSSSDSPEGVG